jgi:hypothetical protein
MNASNGRWQEMAMLDRQKLETILLRRFPGATPAQVAASANAIMGLDDEWDEVPRDDFKVLPSRLDEEGEFRIFRRRMR